ncbi:phosphate transport system permease protein [Curtobacterium flaccumfaciens]|jgi:phosphate transport system permease protein|uniref:Phosphate transport system permease protein PstA n=1 Tax=Curtobacterium salicis TaxID=1779862 RepID=A0ABX0TEQ9_9MICO|nr:phosphate ABC transporter permease PstA [Curtobacterium sp. WW7]NII42379.1 phosphate transport system permease protein [Curtobacterium sp. WW7]
MTDTTQAPDGATKVLPTVPPRPAVPASPMTAGEPAGSGSGTVLPLAERSSDPDRGPEVRRVHGVRISDVLCHLGAGLASIAVTVVVFTDLAPVSGPIAFAAVAYVMYLVFYALLVATSESAAVVRDRVIAAGVHSLAFVVVATLVFVVGFSIVRATKALPHLNFYTQDMALTGPLDPMTSGGVLHAIAGSLIQISIALLITVPLGITTALFLTEVPGPFARFVRTIVEAMTALPSIVAGLFIYASVIVGLGVDKSGFAASLAISVMMLPIMIRSADVVLRLVPATLKEASIGLGAGQWQTVWRVVLPTSRSGLVTAVILATARGIGETSPVLLTAGYAPDLNIDPTNGPMISLPLAIFEFVKSPEPNMIARGFGAAAVLMTLVLVLFVIARVIGAQTVTTRERRNERFRATGRLVRRGVHALTPAALSVRRFVDHHVDRISPRLTDSSPKDPS